MSKIGQNFRLYVAIGVIGILAISANPSMAGPFDVLGVVTTELSKYLIVGTDDREAVDTSNTELGANQEAVADSDISSNQRVGGTTAVGGFGSGSSPSLQGIFFPGLIRKSTSFSNENIYVPDENDNGSTFQDPTLAVPTATEQTNNRWNDIDRSASTGLDVVGRPDTLGVAGDTYADANPLYEPVDWSGNVAVTHTQGTIHTTNTDINATLGFQCAGTAGDCDNSAVSNTAFFDSSTAAFDLDGNLVSETAQALAPGTGITGDVVHSALLTELQNLKDTIFELKPGDPDAFNIAAELTITRDFVDFNFSNDVFIADGDADNNLMTAVINNKSTPVVLAKQLDMDELAVKIDSSDPDPSNRGPLIIDLDALDLLGNDDGIVIINVDRGDSAFVIDSTDMILSTVEGTIAIFRAVNGLNNFDFDDSSIMMGAGDWNLGNNPLGLLGDPITEMGALFAIMENPQDDQDNVVFSLDNVILGGIALHDYIDLSGDGNRNEDNNYTSSIVINNAQGCAQFVSNLVNMQNNRWNRCAFAEDFEEVPEPATLPLLLVGLFALRLASRRRTRA